MHQDILNRWHQAPDDPLVSWQESRGGPARRLPDDPEETPQPFEMAREDWQRCRHCRQEPAAPSDAS